MDAARTRELLAAEIRAQRAYRRITQIDLVVSSGLSRSTIGRIENAERDLTVPQLYAICHVLDVSASDLLRRIESADGF